MLKCCPRLKGFWRKSRAIPSPHRWETKALEGEGICPSHTVSIWAKQGQELGLPACHCPRQRTSLSPLACGRVNDLSRGRQESSLLTSRMHLESHLLGSHEKPFCIMRKVKPDHIKAVLSWGSDAGHFPAWLELILLLSSGALVVGISGARSLQKLIVQQRLRRAESQNPTTPSHPCLLYVMSLFIC